MTSKNWWRIFNTQLLKNIAFEVKQSWSNAIVKQFLSWLSMHPNILKIAVYASLKTEVNTNELIAFLLNHHYEVYLPVITNMLENQMQFSKISSSDYAYERMKGIKQPTNHEWIKPTDLDLIIVPVGGFDANKYRIGKGLGYYDKYLKQTKALKIGFAFNIVRCFSFQIDVNDVPLDLIMTESEII